jgi:6-phosphogluconolactonase (cycloisomerase 2 family)
VFRNDSGVLRDQVSIAPNGGFGFGPRHVDFHPTRPWIYVSLERQNAVAMFTHDSGVLAATPAFQASTLTEPENIRGHQIVGTVHVHPNGRFVYVANRASSTIENDGKKVFAGGENTIAVFEIDPDDGTGTDPARGYARHPLPNVPHRPERAIAGLRAHHGIADVGWHSRSHPADVVPHW